MFSININVIFVIMIIISINCFVLICYRIKYKIVYIKRNVIFMIFGIWCYVILVVFWLFYGLGEYVFNLSIVFCFIDKKFDSVSRILWFVVYFILYVNIIIVMWCYVGIYWIVW